MERLSAWSAEHRAFVLSATLVLLLAGLFVSRNLELDALPDITNNQVLILTRAPGLTPEEIERRITRPIETAIGGMPGLLEHRSLSRYGISSVTAVFEESMNPYLARQLVQERIKTLDAVLPAGIDSPELGPMSGGLGEIFHFILTSPSRDTAELFELAQYRLAPLLRRCSGVVEVNTWGGQTRALEVVADPIALAQHHLTLGDIKRALKDSTGSVPGAALSQRSGSQTLLRGVALPKGPTDLAHAIIPRHAADASATIRIADVAQLRWGALPRIGAASANGQGETVYVMAQMLRGANAFEVMEGIHRALPEMRATLPADVQLRVVYDRSQLVSSTLRTVGKSLAEGGLLVVVVLFAMLGSLRAGLIVAAAIPLSMVGATVGMYSLGVPGNLMSLGAIDFGLIVDGAVVVVEQIFHRIAQRPTPPPTRQELRAEISAATRSVARPMFFSVLIVLVVYVPILALSGVDGKMFRPMAITVVLALATSLLVALTFIPAAASAFLRVRDIPARPPWVIRIVERLFPPLLDRVRSHPRAVIGATAAFLAVAVVTFVRAGSEFAPQLDEGDLVVQTTRQPDISIDAAIERTSALEAALRQLGEVEQVVSRIGSPAIATDIMGLEQADIFVRLAPASTWRSDLTKDSLIDEMRTRIERASPGADPAFTQPIQMRFNELLAGAATDVTVAVLGDDLAELRRIARAIAARIEKRAGAVDLRLLSPPEVSLVEVRPRALDAAQHGLTAAELLEIIESLRFGIDVGVTYEGPVRIPIRLLLDNEGSLFSLARTPVASVSGGVISLDRVADIEETLAPGMVNHHDGERRLLVGFNVRGRDLGAVVAEAEADIAKNVPLPHGYRVRWGGQYETLQAARRRLLAVIPVVLLVILGLLYWVFRSMRSAIIIFMHVPVACIGGIMALAARGLPVSMSAAIGFIALSGIAVLNGVVLMTKVLALEMQGVAPQDAAVQAAHARVRPVLMTALVAALGFIPMMLARGVGAEVQRPLATVIVGGLVSATALTLFILPTLYPRLAAKRRMSA